MQVGTSGHLVYYVDEEAASTHMHDQHVGFRLLAASVVSAADRARVWRLPADRKLRARGDPRQEIRVMYVVTRVLCRQNTPQTMHVLFEHALSVRCYTDAPKRVR